MMTTQRKPTAAELVRFSGPPVVSISRKSLRFVDFDTGEVSPEPIRLEDVQPPVGRLNRPDTLH